MTKASAAAPINHRARQPETAFIGSLLSITGDLSLDWARAKTADLLPPDQSPAPAFNHGWTATLRRVANNRLTSARSTRSRRQPLGQPSFIRSSGSTVSR